jgi:5-methylcytosine-specific restriction endonuclease McrA
MFNQNKIMKKCLNCNKDFTPHESTLRRKTMRYKNEGKFCSSKCSAIHKSKNIVPPKPNVVCAYCNKPFYKNNSRKQRSKSGLFFCCREHKDISQRLGGLKEIMPKHFGNGKGSYRTIAFRSLPNYCSKCNYSTYSEILEVHHKDTNRNNNLIENLEILCPNCHMEKHFLEKTGKWSSS